MEPLTARLGTDAAAIATLVRWLGPWADSARRPESCVVEDDVLHGSPAVRVRIYRPRHLERATYLVAPGLHYAGAEDPRMDRFCRILAAAGHLVIAPFIPDFLALVPTARAIDDFERVFAARDRWDPSHRPPTVFSISFGSLLALGLAARRGDELGRLILFGAYGDFPAALRYCLTGHVDGRFGSTVPRDPLNQPVVLMNLLPYLDVRCADPGALVAAWRRYVERTWGRPEMKAPERFMAVARELAADVPVRVRELFLVGVGVLPGADELALPAIARASALTAPLDPRPLLAHVRGRVDIVHGRDDDVIPFEQAAILAAGLTAADARVHLTGLYNHTGGTRLSPATAGRELLAMARLVGVFAARA